MLKSVEQQAKTAAWVEQISNDECLISIWLCEILQNVSKVWRKLLKDLFQVRFSGSGLESEEEEEEKKRLGRDVCQREPKGR